LHRVELSQDEVEFGCDKNKHNLSQFKPG
jgi:hypothetical protein